MGDHRRVVGRRPPRTLNTLRGHGTKLLVDTHGWRYRYAATAEVAKLSTASWAPQSAVSLADKTSGRLLVESSIRAQAVLGADAYIVPGWMPDEPSEDLRRSYSAIFETISAFDGVDARPFVMFIGGHTKGLDRVIELLDEVPHFVSAVYLQLSPIAPSKDSPSKLEALMAVYRHASARGFKVIAGHAGAITPALRAMGVDAADAGLATGEAFDRSGARSSRKKADDEQSSAGGRRSRMYFSQIDRSLDAKVVETLMSVPGAAAELRGCRLPCHRFRGGHLLDHAREHSLWSRVEEAQLVDSLPRSMRMTQVYERLRSQRSVLATINGALDAANQETLDPKPLENRLTWVSRTIAMASAA
ncbi:MAG: hypothetical protein JWN62_3455 [Acidimicrobiales bacterium]|nr:hypothetical protein [Acidimicrobiales bacterium]